jgi:hypothetical protein
MQLWTFYQGLNPQKNRHAADTIPIPVPPCGGIIPYSSVIVQVEFHRYSISVRERIRTIDEALTFLPSALTQLIGSYVEIPVYTPTFQIQQKTFYSTEEQKVMYGDKTLRIHQFTKPRVIVREASTQGLNTVQSMDMTYLNTLVCMICVCFYNPKTNTWLTKHDLPAVDGLQLSLQQLGSDPQEDWDIEDKVTNYLNIPQDVRVYTKTFQRPRVFEYPVNYFITGCRNDITEPLALEAKRFTEMKLYWKWNTKTPVGTQMHVWTINNNLCMYHGGVLAIRYDSAW